MSTATRPKSISKFVGSTGSLAWQWPVALLLVLGAALLRVLFLLSDAAFCLVPDEAHYWDWSRQLDWCYYSKGPLVAWLIRGSCFLFGEDTLLAVRFPAILCGILTQLGIFVLSLRVFQFLFPPHTSKWNPLTLALATLSLTLCMPLFHLGSLLMTIDGPYCAAWVWALVLSHQLLFAAEARAVESKSGWLLLGLVIGIGILAKHNMALFVPSIGLFLLLSPTHRKLLVSSSFWLMTITAVIVGGGPILYWNSQHDWVTFQHVFRQAGITEQAMVPSAGWRWLGPLEYLAGQAGIMLVFGFVIWAIAMVQAGRKLLQSVTTDFDSQAQQSQRTFLFVLSLPMFLAFLLFSIKTRTEPNWPIVAYLSGLVLAMDWLIRHWSTSKLLRRTTFTFCLLGLLLSLLIHKLDLFYPVHKSIAPQSSVRKWDATCRMRGWDQLGQHLDQLRETNPGIILAGTNSNLPGELAFYTQGRPTVYCLARASGARLSQYDMWKNNPIDNPAAFVGKDFLIVGDITPTLEAAFETREPTSLFRVYVQQLEVAAWPVTLCRKFTGKGLDQLPKVMH